MSTANTFDSLQPNLKDTYSDSGDKKKRFKKLRAALKSKGKATAELDASKNPQAFEKANIEPSIKDRKGVAV